MAHEVIWIKAFVDEFIELGNLTEDEEKIFRSRVKGWSRTKQAMEFNMGLSKVDTHIRRLKMKYDLCQPYSDILPPRKKSKEEDYMDSH